MHWMEASFYCKDRRRRHCFLYFSVFFDSSQVEGSANLAPNGGRLILKKSTKLLLSLGGSKTQIHRLHRLHRLRIFLKIAEHQSVFYFFKKTQTQYYKTQTGRVLLNGTYLSGMQQAQAWLELGLNDFSQAFGGLNLEILIQALA